MRQCLLMIVCVLFFPFVSFSQSNDSNKIIGNWKYTDKENKVCKIFITKDSWNNIQDTEASSFAGKYVFIAQNKLHIFYWDKPREEWFVTIYFIDDNTFIFKIRGSCRKHRCTRE